MNNLFKKFISITIIISMIFGMMSINVYAAETKGTFTAVSMNVDGLPQKIFGVSLNADGPGSDGTKAISSKMATYGWDIIGVSEDFNYNTELMSALSSNYNSGTHRGGVSWLTNDTDGLNLIWKKSISVVNEKWTVWNDEYSSGFAGTGNGADSMIEKGYRFYQATVADGVTVDVYILHMDAASDAEDIAAREKQLTQLREAIKASNNKNPIIVMGDTNCRYTRESLQSIFIDGINADSRFTIQDAWIEKVRNGSYPTKGADALVAVDKGGTYNYPEAEIVDKVFYINNTDSEVQLNAKSYTIATDFTNASGTALADHWPVVVEFEYSMGSAECQHNYVENRVEATCTTDGSIAYTCEKCADSYSETIAATGHDYKESGRIEATCTVDGSITYTCNNCKDSYSNVIDAIGHNYVEGLCSNCGQDDPEYPKECQHNYIENRVEATCTVDGSITYTCEKCGDSYSETITATGHNYKESGRVEATCTVDGSITYTCEKCGDGYSETIEAKGHNYNQSSRVEATCTVDGKITYTCGGCGDSYNETIAATGHNYVNGTCTSCGEKDPTYNEDAITLGGEASSIISGNKYVFALKSTSGVFAMQTGSNNGIASTKIGTTVGTEISDNLVWTVTETNGKYTISTEIDDETYYVARTKSFTGYGYKITLQKEEYHWYMTKYNNGFRFYDKTYLGSKYYLRYYNARQGWIATTKAATLTLFDVE